MGQSLSVAPESALNSVATSNNVRKLALEPSATSRGWLPELAKALWPAKTAATLRYLTEAPERTCYDWVKGTVEPPSRALLRLLHSDQGWRVLEYLMRGCTQRWWLETVRARECSLAYEARREQLQLPL